MDPQPDAAKVRSQLERLRSSAVFSRSARLCELLQFLVEETIDGRGHTLKELVVGEAIYGHNAPYDPSIDSTVRVEARRLRRKLIEYYEGPGYDAPFRIVLPGGGYRPTFEQNEHLPACSQFGSNCHDGVVDLAIMPFRALSSSHLDGQFADGLTDELIYLLDRASSLRLAPRLAVFQYTGGNYSLREAANTLNTRAMLHGTLRALPTHIRLSLEISDAGGVLVWSERFDTAAGNTPHDEEMLAEEIVAHLPTWIMIPQSVPRTRSRSQLDYHKEA